MKTDKQLFDLESPHWIEDFGETPRDIPSDLSKYGARICIMWPVIDVANVKDIPKDWPGPMAVPITFLDKIERNNGKSGFRIVGKVHHGVLTNGKRPYQKLLVINTALREREVVKSLGKEQPT